MDCILTSEPWCSRSSNPYFSNLQRESESNWTSFDNVAPIPSRTLKQLKTDLKRETDSRTINQINLLLIAAERMRDCSNKEPCRLFGCRKCSQRHVYETACQVASKVAAFTNSQRGRAAAMTIKCDAWKGTLTEAIDQMTHDMRYVIGCIENNFSIAGYRLAMDVKPLPNGHYHLHAHGTLLSHFGHIKDTLDSCQEQLEEMGIAAQFWCQNLKGNYRDSTGRQRTEFVSLSEAAGWCCYSEKLHHAQRLTADQSYDVQIHLQEKQQHWSGGSLAAIGDMPDSYNLQQQLVREFEQLDGLCRKLPGGELLDFRVQVCKSQPKLSIDHLVELIICYVKARSKICQPKRPLDQYLKNVLEPPKYKTIPTITGPAVAIFTAAVFDRSRVEHPVSNVPTQIATELREVNDYWPTLLPHETEDKLDWDTYWKAVSRFIENALISC